MVSLSEVLIGFGSVAIIIVVGWLVARRGLLGAHGAQALNMTVYWVALPCMLVSTLATADVGHVFGSQFGVAALSALAVMAVYLLVAPRLVQQRSTTAVVGGMAASYNNVANLGIPIAAAVLHDTTAVIPALIFQIAFYAPICLTVMDILESRHSSGGALRRVRLRDSLLTPLRNPIFLAAMTGLVIGLARTRFEPIANFPEHPASALVLKPVELLSGAAVPMALLAFGASLAGAPALRRGISPRRAVALSTLGKNILQPALAAAIGYFLFGLTDHALLSVVVVAALPTAQNVYTFASRFGMNTVQARDTGIVTTLSCVPVILLIALVLG